MDRPRFSEEQMAIFKRMVTPTVFDPSPIKRKFLDVQYGTLPEQKVDVYLPDEGDGPFPLIIYVHGGGWSMGNKREGALPCIIDAIKYGYAVISVDYRLAPGVKFPEFLFDVKTAVRWARANAKQYLFDPDRFGMVGDSAGGHLTLMVGFTAGHPEYEGEQYGWEGVSSAVQAIIDMYGPSILDADRDAFLKESGVPAMNLGAPPPKEGGAPASGMAGAFTADMNMLHLISPIQYVHKDIPPTMIQQGMKDPIVPMQNSTLLAEKIEKVCGKDRVDLRLYPERTHSDGAFMGTENCMEVLPFFDKYLK